MNLATALIQAASGGSAGVIFIRPDGTGEKVSYNKILKNSLKMLGQLQSRGMGAGSELIIQTEDNQTLLQLFWACILGKIIPVPLSSGVQAEQKNKLFKVWKCLSHPFLICDEGQLDRISSFANSAGMTGIFGEIRQQSLLFPLVPEADGQVAAIDPQDLAYIQFSSGSTGDPKGVALTHDNLLCNIADVIKSLEIGKTDKLLSWMPLTHDMGMIGFHLTGIVKGIDAISIPTSLFIRRPMIWMEKASEYKASILYSPNSGLDYFLLGLKRESAPAWDLRAVRLIVNGAEAISSSLCRRFVEALAPYGLHENAMLAAYGLAEASVEVACMPVNTAMRCYWLDRKSLNIGDAVTLVEEGSGKGASFVDVGCPVPSCELRVCDDQDRILPADRVGHIQIRGRNVTRGYYNAPAATRELFTRDGWMRTGDVGFLRQGRLTVTGRYKNIIIVNGQNYYPQDIERSIIEKGIAGAGKVVACGARGREGEKEELLLFVLHKGPAEEFIPVAGSVSTLIAGQIGIGVDKVIPVSRIPKTTSGKIQHFRLLEQYYRGVYDAVAVVSERERGNMEPGSEKPGENPFRNELINIVRVLTGLEELDGNSRFSEIAVNSIAAVRLAGRIRELTRKEISPADVFACNSVEAICQFLAGSSPAFELPPIKRTERPVSLSLSPAQRRLWMEYQLCRSSAAYNVPVIYICKGAFDAALWERSIKKLIQKYEILRTSFDLVGDGPEQLVHSYADELFRLQYFDLRGASDQGRQEQISREYIDLPFTLETPCQLRAVAIRLEEDLVKLIFVIHHILTDGWSLSILFRELSACYNGADCQEDSAADDIPQFGDYICWQQQLLASSRMEESRRYWRDQLKAIPEAVHLSENRQMPEETRIRVGHYRYAFSVTEAQDLKDLAVELGVTPFCVVMSLLNVLAYRYTNKRDILIGFDVAGRVAESMDGLPGYLINTLCLRTGIKQDQPFGELVGEIKGKLLLALEHQLYPFEQMLEDARGSEFGYGNPLFGILVLYQDFMREATGFGLKGCSLKREYEEANDGFTDLVLEFVEEADDLRLNIRYNLKSYDLPVITRLTEHFCNLLRAFSVDTAGNICRVDLLTTAEKAVLLPLESGCGSGMHYRLPVQLIFENRARISPDSIAVVAGDQSLTYRELNEKANRIAALIKNKGGVLPDDRIGFMTGRNEKMIIAMLAILKAGGAYVAMDPDLPMHRCEQIVADSQMKYLLTEEAMLDALSDVVYPGGLITLDGDHAGDEPVPNPVFAGTMDNLAYVIYTSGSTGKPKGVMVDHSSLSGYVWNFVYYFEVTRADVFLQQASVAFDTIVEEIFPALCTSGKIVIARNGGRDIDNILSLIARNSVTVLSTTPLVLHEINNYADSRIATLRVAISGGDVLHASDIDRLFNNVPVYNTYGPAEATVCATYKKLESPGDASSIGKPIPRRRVYILDENGQVMPVGKAGEMYLEGGLARGYLNLPELTAEKFIVSPIDGKTRLFRSGDRGRWMENGEIEFLGRRDNQLKVRGHRVEPEEIENAIKDYPGVETVAVARGNVTHQLVAFLQVNTHYSANDLRLHILNRLPSYMMPYRFEIVDALPLSTTGKIDRRRLTAMAGELKAMTGDREEAAAGLEQQLLALLRGVLQARDLGMNDNFFEYGCNSIVATRIAGLILRELQYRIGIGDIFLYPTCSLLADRMHQLARSFLPPISVINESSHYELSPAQKGLWILHRMNPGSIAYNEGEIYEIQGLLDAEGVRDSFRRLAERHEILRTTFLQVDGLPRQKVHPAEGYPVNFIYKVLSDEEYLVARELAEGYFREAFDLEKGPLYRVVLLELTDKKYLLTLVLHHIITDDLTGRLLIRDFFSFYQCYGKSGMHAEPAPLKFQYKDYVYWNRDNAARQPAHQDYWMRVFKERPPVLELPLDYPRPPYKNDEAETRHHFINPDVLAGLKACCSEQNSSLFMVLLSGLAILLSKYTGQDDLVIGTPVSSREHPDFADIAGFFVNILPLRIRLDADDRPAEIIRKVRMVCLEAYEHKNFSFNDLINDLHLDRDLSRSPLVDVLMSFKAADRPADPFATSDINLSRLDRRVGGSKCDWAFYFEEQEDSMSWMVEYDTLLFSRQHMMDIGRHFEAILRWIVSRDRTCFRDLDYLCDDDKELVLDRFNGTSVIFPDLTVPELIVQRAAADPDKICLRCGGVTLTYRQLRERAALLEKCLRDKYHVVKNDRVGLLLDRSENIIFSILAVWNAGATYVPIDTGWPDERIIYVLKDAGISLVLTDKNNFWAASRLAGHAPFAVCVVEEPVWEAGSDCKVCLPAPAAEIGYVMYTSGTTGEPKGVEVYQASLVNVLMSLKDQPGSSPEDVMMSISTYVFDISVSEFFLPLVTGGTLVLATRDEVLDIGLLKRLIQLTCPTLMQATPSLWNALFDSGWEGCVQLKAITCGEPLGEELKIKLLRGVAQLWNFYGPTETTIFSTGKRILTEKETVTIGSPVINTSIYILDRHQQLTPVGVFGEIFIGGNGVARGYLHRPELSAQRFPDGIRGITGRVFASGDTARWRRDGTIEYRGRRDGQVKIRGFRIELGEVENRILAHRSIKSAAVVVWADGPDDKVLVCYMVCQEGNEATEEDLRRYLRSVLPHYMIPAYFIRLMEMPVTANGKIDRGQLAAGRIPVQQKEAAGLAALPETRMEKQLVNLFEKILNRKDIAVTDSFFDLGGHSLKANQLVNKIYQDLGVEIGLAEIFIHPTVKQLAVLIGSAEQENYRYIELS